MTQLKSYNPFQNESSAQETDVPPYIIPKIDRPAAWPDPPPVPEPIRIEPTPVPVRPPEPMSPLPPQRPFTLDE